MVSRIAGACIAFVALAFVASAGTAVAGGAGRNVPPPIFIGGQFVHQPALLESGHLLVPVRGVFEALHASVAYTPPRIVVVRKNESVLAGLVIDRQHAVVNNRPRSLAIAPVRRSGHVYVPLRIIAEILGATVIYSSRPRLVDIHVQPDAFAVAPAPPPEAVPPPDSGPPLWALAMVGTIVLAFAAECARRGVTALSARRGRASR
jgi:hypothetical protein